MLLLLDTGLRVSKAAGIRLGDLRLDRSVMGKGAKERIVPLGSTARGAIVRYIGQRGPRATDAPLFLGRRGALDWRGMQQVFKRLKTGAGITGGAAGWVVSCTYLSTPKIERQEASPINYDGALLSIIDGGRLTIDGEYWNDRASKGRMTFRKHHQEIARSFENAKFVDQLAPRARRDGRWHRTAGRSRLRLDSRFDDGHHGNRV